MTAPLANFSGSARLTGSSTMTGSHFSVEIAQWASSVTGCDVISETQ